MRTRQHGIAIVLAMSVVALAALTATAMIVAQSTWSRQIELTAGRAQAQFVLQGGLDWARALLSDDSRAGMVDHLGEPWAMRLPPVVVENGTLVGHIEDQQARFNLNNLLKNGKLNPAQLATFRRLLPILAMPPALADALAEQFETGGRPLVDLAELAQVRGFDDGVRARLRPFVTALPRYTTVNPNTASPEVLAAVIEGLGLDDARALIAQRKRTYFRNIPEFLSQLPQGLTAPAENFAVNSDYFLATLRVTIGGAQAHGVALLERGKTGGWPAIVWRKYP